MFGKVKKTAQDNIKIQLNLKKMAREARENGRRESEEKIGPAVSEGITKIDFFDRYSNLRWVLIILIFMMIGTVLIGVFNFSLMSLIICTMTNMLFGMFYFKYSFIAYRARMVYSKWDLRHESHIMEVQEYLDAISVNPMEIFPLKILKEK